MTRGFADRPYYIGGLGGEIGRGFFWRPTDNDSTKVTPEGIWARIGMPRHQEAMDAVTEWRTSLEGWPGLQQLDLAYLEIRMGCWGFAASYANTTPISIHPLISRRSFAAMLSLPPEWRRRQQGSNPMIKEVIRQHWPELLEYPIGRYGD